MDIKIKYFRYLKINSHCGCQKYLFWISEIVIFDIQNNYSWYQKLCRNGVLFQISKIVILDINYKYFWHQKINIYFGYQKLLFWISEIVIFDIWNSFLDIWNLCDSILDIQNTFQISRILFWISRIIVLDIWKKWINVNSACHRRRYRGKQSCLSIMRWSQIRSDLE